MFVTRATNMSTVPLLQPSADLPEYLVVFVQVDVKQCHYLVDLETDEETPLEPRYSTNKEEWSVIAFKPFLQTSRFFLSLFFYKYMSECFQMEMHFFKQCTFKFLALDPLLSSERSTSHFYQTITPPTGGT